MSAHAADWSNQRQKVQDAQNNACYREDCPYVGSLDVIMVHGVLRGFCRRDRLRIDASERCNKAARTRGDRGKQARMF